MKPHCASLCARDNPVTKRPKGALKRWSFFSEAGGIGAIRNSGRNVTF